MSAPEHRDILRILAERAVASGRPLLTWDEWLATTPRFRDAGPGLPEKGQSRQEYIEHTVGRLERHL